MLCIILLFCTFLPRIIDEVNIGCTWTLLNLMEEFGCRSIVFSSSATVYGVAKDEKAKLKETDEVGVTITNCYGRTKYMIEQILGDFHGSHAILRESKARMPKNGVLPFSGTLILRGLILLEKWERIQVVYQTI